MRSYKCFTSSSDQSKQISTLSATLKLVSEESRLKLLCLLRRGQRCVCELVGQGGMSQSLVSHHLSDLKASGIVSDEKRGQRVYYSLTAKGKHIAKHLFGIFGEEVVNL